MRKNLFAALVCILISPFLFSQMGIARQRELQRKQDSLKAIVSNLNGIAKVDALNRIVDIYQKLDDDDQMQVDSATPYATLSTIEAKKIGYKRGLGYSYLKLVYCEYLKAWIYKEKNKTPDFKHLESIEQMIKQAMQIGEELKDDIMMASSYVSFGRIENLKGNKEKMLDFYKKAIASIEKNSTSKQRHEYEEMWFPPSDNCIMNEIKIGWLYTEMGFAIKDTGEIKKYLDLAITHYEKSGSLDALGKAYMLYARRIGINNNAETGVEYSKKAIAIFQKSDNKNSELHATMFAAASYWAIGDFENGFDYSKKSVRLAEILLKANPITDLNKVDIGMAYFWMGRYYSIAGDYETGLRYMQNSLKFFAGNPGRTGISNAIMGDMYRRMGNYDSAMHFLLPFEKVSGPAFGKDYLSRLYITLKQYDKALLMINENIEGDRKAGNIGNMANNYTDRAKAWLGKKNYRQALADARTGYILISNTKRNSELTENCLTLSEVFYKIGNTDSAYLYLKKYMTLKDSIVNRQLIIRLNDYKKEAEEERKISQLNLLNKDNQLKEQKLKQQATLRNSLVAGIALLSLLGLFVFRSFYLKRKKQQAEYEKKQTDLEMQALRAQMNPHFIFNCLSSINRYILKNETDTASDYLTRFSRLIRMVLMNSQKPLITLEDELDMLTIYLDMERLRFKSNFDYHIIFTNRVDAGAIYIPPLLLQPFCENAIWHGLKHLADPQSGRQEHGRLDIILNVEDNVLHCSITDNGIGRKKAAETRSKSAEENKSMGLKITTERLALLNQEKENLTSFEIVDLENEKGEAAGTTVKLKIFLSESAEVYV